MERKVLSVSNTLIIMIVNPYLHARKFVEVPEDLNVDTFIELINEKEPCRPHIQYLYQPETSITLEANKSFAQNGVVDGDLFYLF